MTKFRAPASIEEAITAAHGILGDERASNAVGKSSSMIRKWSDPDDDGHNIQMRQALALDLACKLAGEPAPIIAAYKLALARAVAQAGGPAHDPLHPFERMTEVMTEVGDISGEIRAAICSKGVAGSAVVQREAARILAAIDEAVSAFGKLKLDVLAMVQDDHKVARFPGAAE